MITDESSVASIREGFKTMGAEECRSSFAFAGVQGDNTMYTCEGSSEQVRGDIEAR